MGMRYLKVILFCFYVAAQNASFGESDDAITDKKHTSPNEEEEEIALNIALDTSQGIKIAPELKKIEEEQESGPQKEHTPYQSELEENTVKTLLLTCHKKYLPLRKKIAAFLKTKETPEELGSLEEAEEVIEKAADIENKMKNVFDVVKTSMAYMIGLRKDLEELISKIKESDPKYKSNMGNKKEKTKADFQESKRGVIDWVSFLYKEDTTGDKSLKANQKTFLAQSKEIDKLLKQAPTDENIYLTGENVKPIIEEQLQEEAKIISLEETREIKYYNTVPLNSIEVKGAQKIFLKENAVVFFAWFNLEKETQLEEVLLSYVNNPKKNFFTKIWQTIRGTKKYLSGFLDVLFDYEDSNIGLGGTKKLRIVDYAVLLLPKLNIKDSSVVDLQIECRKHANIGGLLDSNAGVDLNQATAKLSLFDFGVLLLGQFNLNDNIAREFVLKTAESINISSYLKKTESRSVDIGMIDKLTVAESALHLLPKLRLAEKNEIKECILMCQKENNSKIGGKGDVISLGKIHRLQVIDYAAFLLGQLEFPPNNIVEELKIKCRNDGSREKETRADDRKNRAYVDYTKKLKDRSIDIGSQIQKLELAYYGNLFLPKLILPAKNVLKELVMWFSSENERRDLLERNKRNISIGRIKSAPQINPAGFLEEVDLRMDYVVVGASE